MLSGLLSLAGYNPPSNTPEVDPACAAFESAEPRGATIFRVSGPSVRVSADAPSKVSAESVSYSITDGTNQHDGEVTGDTDVSVTIPTQNPGPWSPTDADFVGVRIAMKLGRPLTRFDDPEAVELCNQSVCKGTSYHVLGVPAGEVYFAVFATDDLLPGGNLADGASVKATVSGLSAWRSLSAGAVMSYGIASDGSLWGWGSAVQSPTWVSPVAPVRVGSDTDWKKVSCGALHILAIRNDGRLFGWGGAPKQIGTATDWVDIAAGHGHSLGVRADGTLWAWGTNTSGQLGDGTTTLRSEPVRVGTDSDWASVGVGSAHSLAIKKDGSLWAWGSNINGELGDGTRTNRRTPVRIGTGNDWTRVVGGYSASIGPRGTGTLWGWGYPGLNGTDPNFIVTSPAQIGVIRIENLSLVSWDLSVSFHAPDARFCLGLSPSEKFEYRFRSSTPSSGDRAESGRGNCACGEGGARASLPHQPAPSTGLPSVLYSHFASRLYAPHDPQCGAVQDGNA